LLAGEVVLGVGHGDEDCVGVADCADVHLRELGVGC
jgi:hypothetical protein